MGFRQDAYARVWSAENRGKYTTCRVSISKKNKETNAYTTEFQDGFVRFVGKAHELISNTQIDNKKGLPIKILSCDVTNLYTAPEGKVSYDPHYTIFDFEIQGDNSMSVIANAVTKPNVNDFMPNPDDTDDTELPFN
jgi:hypothetical protein